MDFSCMLLEYKYDEKNGKRGKFWWKNGTWNKEDKGKKVRVDRVEKAFSKQDYILGSLLSLTPRSVTSSASNVLNGAPLCPTCCSEMKLFSGSLGHSDSRNYRCSTCLERVEHQAQVMFAAGSLHADGVPAHRVLLLLKSVRPRACVPRNDGERVRRKRRRVGKASVYALYALARERISRA